MLLILLFVELIWISVSDIKSRYISNASLIILLLTIIFYSIATSHFNFQSVTWALAVVIIGIVLSVFNIVGAGDTKLLAILLLGINKQTLILTPVLLSFFILVTIILYWIIYRIKPVYKKLGLPLAPAISLAGWLCIWLS